jgi:hypothetical protein
MVLRPARRDIDPDARSHEGSYDGFSVAWLDAGWWVVTGSGRTGPFHTSQAAFGAAKDAIDQLIQKETKR